MVRKVHVYAVLAGLLAVTGVIGAAQSGIQVFRFRDDCDPATFNSAPPDGPGAGVICNPAFDGDVTFNEFIDELATTQEAEHWRIQPDDVRLERGQATRLDNRRAGEFHTFTRVEEFGGGILPGLNALSGAGATRPECGAPEVLAPPSATNVFLPDGAVVNGPIAGSAELPRGTTKWQCCLHPWMKSEVRVRAR